MKIIIVGQESQREIKDVIKALKPLGCEVILVTDETKELKDKINLMQLLKNKLVVQPLIDDSDHLLLRKTKMKFDG